MNGGINWEKGYDGASDYFSTSVGHKLRTLFLKMARRTKRKNIEPPKPEPEEKFVPDPPFANRPLADLLSVLKKQPPQENEGSN